jgi:hypothetical protein
LSHINEQRLHTPWQQNVFTKLLGLDYKIVYKKGTYNKVADALFRKPTPQYNCCALSSTQPQWLDVVVESYEYDAYTKDIIAKAIVQATTISDFSWSNGLLRYKSRIWMGDDSNLKLSLIETFHSSAMGGGGGYRGACNI